MKPLDAPAARASGLLKRGLAGAIAGACLPMTEEGAGVVPFPFARCASVAARVAAARAIPLPWVRKLDGVLDEGLVVPFARLVGNGPFAPTEGLVERRKSCRFSVCGPEEVLLSPTGAKRSSSSSSESMAYGSFFRRLVLSGMPPGGARAAPIAGSCLLVLMRGELELKESVTEGCERREC